MWVPPSWREDLLQHRNAESTGNTGRNPALTREGKPPFPECLPRHHHPLEMVEQREELSHPSITVFPVVIPHVRPCWEGWREQVAATTQPGLRVMLPVPTPGPQWKVEADSSEHVKNTFHFGN